MAKKENKPDFIIDTEKEIYSRRYINILKIAKYGLHVKHSKNGIEEIIHPYYKDYYKNVDQEYKKLDTKCLFDLIEWGYMIESEEFYYISTVDCTEAIRNDYKNISDEIFYKFKKV